MKQYHYRALILDDEYRRLAEQGKLRCIAPRRFNPRHEVWLPVMKTTRNGQHYTVMFSNTARAHKFGMTHDWVLIFQDESPDAHWTVITANYGRLHGCRIVRGREAECLAHYLPQRPVVARPTCRQLTLW